MTRSKNVPLLRSSVPMSMDFPIRAISRCLAPKAPLLYDDSDDDDHDDDNNHDDNDEDVTMLIMLIRITITMSITPH